MPGTRVTCPRPRCQCQIRTSAPVCRPIFANFMRSRCGASTCPTRALAGRMSSASPAEIFVKMKVLKARDEFGDIHGIIQRPDGWVISSVQLRSFPQVILTLARYLPPAPGRVPMSRAMWSIFMSATSSANSARCRTLPASRGRSSAQRGTGPPEEEPAVSLTDLAVPPLCFDFR
jgi:hypothetical protein